MYEYIIDIIPNKMAKWQLIDLAYTMQNIIKDARAGSLGDSLISG